MEQIFTKKEIDQNASNSPYKNYEGGASEIKMSQEKSYYDDF